MDEYKWLDKHAVIKDDCMLMGFQFKQKQLEKEYSVKGTIIKCGEEIAIRGARKLDQKFNQN